MTGVSPVKVIQGRGRANPMQSTKEQSNFAALTDCWAG